MHVLSLDNTGSGPLLHIYALLTFYYGLSHYVQVEEKIEEYKKKGSMVAGIITEPIQAEGGDNFATPEFFQELKHITMKVFIHHKYDITVSV